MKTLVNLVTPQWKNFEVIIKIKINNSNPFGFDRYGFLWEMLKKNKSLLHLDYGCYDGRILKILCNEGLVIKGIGLDLNREVISEAIPNMTSNIDLIHLSDTNIELPFPNFYFDSISILDVIEHVYEQEKLLFELNRVLKDDGILIITAPKKHIFSFFDTGNFKFLFPTLHYYYYKLFRSSEEYNIKFVESVNGLFGDIDTRIGWHQHFSQKDLQNLLGATSFVDLTFDGTGLLNRPLILFKHIFPIFKSGINKLINIDSKLFSQANIFCLAGKKND